MDKLTAIKIKYDDGTYSDEIPVSVLSENVEWDSTHTLVDVLGSIDIDGTGTIQDQISQLFNEKVSTTQLQSYVANQLNTDVTNWLNNNVNPVGSAVVVDSSLSIEGAAADAAKVGASITNLSLEVEEGQFNPNFIDFRNGRLNQGTVVTHNSAYRVVMKNIEIATREITFTPLEGFRIMIAIYINGVWDGKGSGNSFFTTPVVVPKNSEYRLCIARISTEEDTSEIADKELFCKNVTYSSFISDLVERTITDKTLTVEDKPADAQKVGEELTQIQSDITDVQDNLLKQQIIQSYSGNPINFNYTQFKSLAINFLLNQSGSGTPSPSNVRTINGYKNIIFTNNNQEIIIPLSDNETTMYGGLIKYNHILSQWTINFNIAYSIIPYSYFRNLSTQNFGINSLGQFWIRNFGYNTGNGIEYRNRDRKRGGYYCISNVLNIIGFNNTSLYNSQCRLFFTVENCTTVADFLLKIDELENNNIPIVIAYEPTDNIPSYTINTQPLSLTENNDTTFISNPGTIEYKQIVNVQSYIDTQDTFLNDEIINIKSDQDIVLANQDAINKIYASRWLRDATANPFTLLHFSDIHRGVNPLKRIITFKNFLQNKNLLNDTICTGDLVKNSTDEQAAYQDFWYNTPGTEDILISIGNHDTYNVGSQPHGKATIEKKNNLFFQTISQWGDVIRDGIAPYYYKDYPNELIRLIVVDPSITEDEMDETTWLNNVLSDAIIKNYAVIVASHYLRTPSSTATIYDNSWSNNRARLTHEDTMTYDWAGCDIIDCVTNFINNGGIFVCYLIGHTHTDILAYPTNHPEQLIIHAPCASWDRGHETTLTTNDLPRFENTKTQDAFNIITVDATNKILKVVRVGSDTTMYMERRQAFSYNFLTHNFINIY